MPIDRLTATDQLMLRASRTWPQDNGALALLDGTALLDIEDRLRIGAVREAIEAKLHLAPRFRQVIFVPPRGLGGPLWVDAPHFDIKEHIREVPVAPPGAETELLFATEQLRRQPLGLAKPLWEMWFLTGLPEKRLGLFIKIHHAVADGMSAMRTFASLLDTVPDAIVGRSRPWQPALLPSSRELRADIVQRRQRMIAAAFSTIPHASRTLRRVLNALPAAHEVLAEQPATDTSLNRLVGLDRNLALLRSSMDLVKQIAHAHRATVNDVLLALTAGGVRALFQRRGERVEDITVRISVPVSLRSGADEPRQGNQIGDMVVPVRLAAADPVRRLHQIAAETAKRKTRSRTSLGTFFRGGITDYLVLKAVARQRVNVTTTNIHGPELPLYLAGARVLEVFPVLTLLGNQTVAVGALSYGGAFNMCLVGDRAAVPDLEVFAAGIRDELDALGASTRSMRLSPEAAYARV
jgi:diacylglycerol O-acyltransferase / wax synthase